MTILTKEVVTGSAAVPTTEAATPPTGQAIIDVCAEIQGVLTDDEIDEMFARNRTASRALEL